MTKSETEIWICDRNFENHRKVYDVHCGNHNGPSATFITNSLIVFRDVEFEGIAGKEPSICVFRILDVDTGEVKYKIRGKESHCAENGKYPFSISTEYLDKNPDYPEINSCGIYILDVENGKITLVATEEDILNMVREHGLTPNEHTASVSHVQLNPSATAVMMRLGVKKCPVFGALGCIDLDTKKTHMIADKPVHQLWFDDDTYMATRQFNQGRHIEMETSYIARFSKDGEELEVLGGISNHMDGSFVIPTLHRMFICTSAVTKIRLRLLKYLRTNTPHGNFRYIQIRRFRMTESVCTLINSANVTTEHTER